MSKVFLAIVLASVAAMSSSVYGQAAPPGAGTPPGAGDKNLGDDGIKARSIEIERMKQEAKRAEASKYAPISKQIAVKFPEIKEDYEGIQIAQTTIVNAYTIGKTIDYALIGASAEAITKKAKRLDANLFAPTIEKRKTSDADTKVKAGGESQANIKDLIVDLDNAVGRFVASKLFANISVIEPEVAVNTRADLMIIQHLSERLASEAAKLNRIEQ